MVKTTLKIDGMMCGMCEAHMNDAIRAAFAARKVTSSHVKKQTVIIAENDIDDAKLAETVKSTGYQLTGITREPYEKKGLLGIFKK